MTPLQLKNGVIISLSNAKVITDESEELASKSKDSIVELFEDIKDIATEERKDEDRLNRLS